MATRRVGNLTNGIDRGAVFEHGIDLGHQSSLGEGLYFALVHGFEKLLQSGNSAKARAGARSRAISKAASNALMEEEKRFSLVIIEPMRKDFWG